MIVYISIGNSDDKLTQAEWSAFQHEARDQIRRHAHRIIGEWYSAPDAAYQNACFAADLGDADHREFVKMRLGEVREKYRQDSAAWAEVAETGFV